MTFLVIGLLVFLGVHCVGFLAPAMKQALIQRFGVVGYKAIYSGVSVLGFVLIVMGYGDARLNPIWVWHPPMGLRHVSSLITLVAMIFLAAYILPNNALKARMGHPMLIAVKAWALAHLLANGTLADLLLFGSFLAWAVMGFIVSRRRDRVSGVAASEAAMPFTLATVALGVLLWAAFAFYLHHVLIGVKPFG